MWSMQWVLYFDRLKTTFTFTTLSRDKDGIKIGLYCSYVDTLTDTNFPQQHIPKFADKTVSDLHPKVCR